MTAEDVPDSQRKFIEPPDPAKRRAFYAAMGFQPLPSRPQRMFIGIETVRKAPA